MRRSTVFAAFAAALAVSCIDRDSLTERDRSREEITSGEVRYDPGKETPRPEADTVLLLCGVEPSGGYDWTRDTLAGSYEAKIVLFESTGGLRKDAQFRRILEIPAGPDRKVSPEPDMHHLLGGHVYTEFSDARRTWLGRDGKELFSFEGRAYLRGLLEKDGALYSLWLDRSGAGLALRKESEILFRRDDAVPFGGFQGPDCLRSGGLYESCGRVCCAFHTKTAGELSFFVGREDGITQVFLPEAFDLVEDLKIAGGKVWAAGRRDGGLYVCFGGESRLVAGKRNFPWNDVFIAETGGEAVLVGRVSNSRGVCHIEGWFERDGGTKESLGTGSVLLRGPDGYAAVQPPSGVLFCVPGGGCACGSSFALALTPLSGGGPPFVRTAAGDTAVQFNGFLTGAEYITKNY